MYANSTTNDFWTRIRREDAAADAHGERRFCGHEECDMEPCSGPIVRREAITADNRGRLVAEASTLGLAPGEWPLVIRVPDRFGALLAFDRLSIDRDDDTTIMAVEYARHDRNRTFVISVLND